MLQHNESKRCNWYEHNSYNYGDHFIINPSKLINQETREAKMLLKLLSIESITDYEKWYQIGQCLHNINIDLLDDWLALCKLCPSKENIYNELELTKLWAKMRLTNSTIASLRYYAYTDNPVEYIKLKNVTA